MLNNLFAIIDNNVSRRGKNPDDLTDMRRMLRAKTDDEFRTITKEIYSKWKTDDVARMLERCMVFELNGGSHQNRIAIEVFEELLQESNEKETATTLTI